LKVPPAGRIKKRYGTVLQALCFMAGANSIFTGEKLLTTPNNDYDQDQQMFKTLGESQEYDRIYLSVLVSVDERK
jgi:biotin synthase-like enzyme